MVAGPPGGLTMLCLEVLLACQSFFQKAVRPFPQRDRFRWRKVRATQLLVWWTGAASAAWWNSGARPGTLICGH